MEEVIIVGLNLAKRVSNFMALKQTAKLLFVSQAATGRIVPVVAIIAFAANTEDRRQIIDLGIGRSEAETFWTDFLRYLKVHWTCRGLMPLL
ncbi:Transposase, Mutator family [Loktanella salsilacus]|jgi:transposase-like protein|uniref:Transposase, Mutator family n=1 Tax=Loktanella salsilacus TaxID=195913 RepID=A0A1I4GXZ9_9RHOB|nr:Transposase, Mutator family [Loktanella salsilacus]